MGALFEALDVGVLMAPLDLRYTQVGFNLISVQVCILHSRPSWAARGFTLAVFLKETSSHRFEWIGGVAVLGVGLIGLNVATFRYCGQDWVRSVVFGLSSTLIPAGYNNDAYFYQVTGIFFCTLLRQSKLIDFPSA